MRARTKKGYVAGVTRYWCSDNSVQLAPGDHQAVEALARYMMRPPVSLVRVKLLPGEDQVLQFPKGSGDDPGSARPERIDALDHGVSVSPVGRQPAGELRLGAISPPAGARGGDRCCSVPFVAR